MNIDTIVGIAQEVIFTLLLLVAPVMIASFVVGVLMSFLQAIFQIHEYTFSFVPKLVAILMVILLYSPWILQKLSKFSTMFLGGFVNYIQ